jgi:hypothetical protein
MRAGGENVLLVKNFRLYYGILCALLLKIHIHTNYVIALQTTNCRHTLTLHQPHQKPN